MPKLKMCMHIIDSVNTKIFEGEFVALHLLSKLWQGAYVIMDNCTTLKAEKIKILSVPYVACGPVQVGIHQQMPRSESKI
jgi:hypothetical protein